VLFLVIPLFIYGRVGHAGGRAPCLVLFALCTSYSLVLNLSGVYPSVNHFDPGCARPCFEFLPLSQTDNTFSFALWPSGPVPRAQPSCYFASFWMLHCLAVLNRVTIALWYTGTGWYQWREARAQCASCCYACLMGWSVLVCVAWFVVSELLVACYAVVPWCLLAGWKWVLV
jgi:hypothetical protein